MAVARFQIVCLVLAYLRIYLQISNAIGTIDMHFSCLYFLFDYPTKEKQNRESSVGM